MSDIKPVAHFHLHNGIHAQVAAEYVDGDPEVFPLYPADALAAVRRQALEEAARVCDEIENGRLLDDSVYGGLAYECAAAIRALIEETPCKS